MVGPTISLKKGKKRVGATNLLHAARNDGDIFSAMEKRAVEEKRSLARFWRKIVEILSEGRVPGGAKEGIWQGGFFQESIKVWWPERGTGKEQGRLEKACVRHGERGDLWGEGRTLN